MRRSLVYGVAGAAFALALVLTLAGVGDDPDGLTNVQALVLGLVQGLTELLPISSSGHLILVPWAAEWTYLEQNDRFNQTFDVALHLGTLVAVGRVLLGRHRPARRRVARLGPASEHPFVGRTRGVVRPCRDDPGGSRRAPRRGRDRRLARGAVADRDPPRRGRRAALVRRSGPSGTRDGRSRHASRGRDGPGAGARAGPRRLTIGNHDHGRPTDAPRP